MGLYLGVSDIEFVVCVLCLKLFKFGSKFIWRIFLWEKLFCDGLFCDIVVVNCMFCDSDML